MILARDVAGTPADIAWASFQIGELYFNSGRPQEARTAYRAGLRRRPGYVPNQAGLGEGRVGERRPRGAIAGYNRVVQLIPSPEYVIVLGDLYTANHDLPQARRQYALVLRAERRSSAANGVNIDLELALFDADHGDPAGALEAARSGVGTASQRPSWPTPFLGRSTRTAATRRPPPSRTGRWHWVRATRCSSSTRA